MFLLPCGAEPARPYQARRRTGAAVAVRHVLRAEYFPRSERRYRTLERGGFRHRRAEGHVALGRALLSGVSLHLLSACEGRGHQRSLRLPQDARAGGGPGARPRAAVSVQYPPYGWNLEMAVS